MRVGRRVIRVEYAWLLTGALALTVTVSYGVLMYSFPVMLLPMQVDLGWSPTLLAGGFSAAALASGVAAVLVGRWVDRCGPRLVMTAGSTLACLLLFAWSRVHEPVTYVLVWVGLGACMAAVFYEPAFTAVAQWLRAGRARAFTLITLAGGLASTIFVPLVSWLVAVQGWRGAVASLALLLGALTIPLHALLLRQPPSPQFHSVAARAVTSGRRPTVPVPASEALRTPSFRWMGIAFYFSTAANFAVAVHLVPILLERGHAPGLAAAALALLGLAKLPGRALVVLITARASARTAIVGVFALQAVALVVLGTVHEPIGVWIFIALFGAGDGASTPARAELLAELFGSFEYGRIGGVLAFILSLGRAAAPMGASLAWRVFGGYGVLVWLLLALVGGALLAMLRVPVAAAGAAPGHVGGRRSPCCVLSARLTSTCIRTH